MWLIIRFYFYLMSNAGLVNVTQCFTVGQASYYFFPCCLKTHPSEQLQDCRGKYGREDLTRKVPLLLSTPYANLPLSVTMWLLG